MPKWVLALLSLVVVAAALAGCGGSGSTVQATPTLSTPAGQPASKIISEGALVPVRSAALGMATNGIVSEVPVQEGDRVASGQLLVRLQSAQLTAAVDQAAAALRRAQAARQKLDQAVDQNQIIAARDDLANALASLQQAQAAYDFAGGATNPNAAVLSTTLSLQQAVNARDAAQARLNTLLEPPKPADVASADADIATAQAGLAQAQAALADSELHAPFAGTVAVVDARVGEEVTAGVVIVQMADFTSWEVQTTDLTEINIARVHVGDPAAVTLDAIPDLELAGQVTRIEPYGTDRQGDIVYKVAVTPDKIDDRLKWNMTAKVTIEPK